MTSDRAAAEPTVPELDRGVRRAGRFTGDVSSPRAIEVAGPRIAVAGWLAGVPESPPVAVRAWGGVGDPVEGTLGVAGADGRVEFRVEGVGVAPGPSELVVEARPADGGWEPAVVRRVCGWDPTPEVWWCVDHPQDMSALPERIEVKGWVFLAGGGRVGGVRVRVGSAAPVVVDSGLERPEIGAAHPAHPLAGVSGFQGREIPVPPGPVVLVFEALHADGQWRAFAAKPAVGAGPASRPRLVARIDHPRETTALPPCTDFAGWVFESGGPPVERVRVRCGDGPWVEVAAGLPRPQVAADHPGEPTAGSSGFHGKEVPIPPGGGDLVAEAATPAGWAEFFRQPAVRAPAVPVVRWCLDHPRPGSEVPERFEIHGWVFQEAGPALGGVRVRIGGGPPRPLEHGRPRPEVAAAHPDTAEASRSGFAGFDLPSPEGPFEVVLEALHGGGDWRPFHAWPVTGAPRERREVRCCVDHPTAWEALEPRMDFTGWVFVEGEPPVGAVRVRFDGGPWVDVPCGLERPEVATVHTGQPGASRSGFRATALRVPAGVRGIEAEARDAAGEWRVVVSRPVSRAPREPVLRWWIDHPTEWGALPGRFETSGWAFLDEGPAAGGVRVRVGGGAPLVLAHGEPRPGVAADFPDVAGAAVSGFSGRGLPFGEEAAEVVFEALWPDGTWRSFAARAARRVPGSRAPVLLHCIDHPQDWERLPERIEFKGWVFLEGGAELGGVRLRVGEDAPLVLEYGISRAEIGAAYPATRQAGVSGFFGKEIPLRTRAQALVAEALWPDGVWRPFFEKEVRMCLDPQSVPGWTYQDWIRDHDTLDEADRRAGRAAVLRENPLISVVMPVYNPPPRWLDRAIESVAAQLYGRWELCIADDASTDPAVGEVLARWSGADPRVRVRRRERNGHISAASNTALELCSGSHVALLDHDDELAEDALLEVASAVADRPSAGLVYSDEDKMDEEGQRFSPFLKPDWSPDLLLAQNYLCHLSVYRREHVQAVGGFREGFEGSQDWDLALRVVERLRPEQIVHIPRVLYHWRAIPGSTAHALTEKSYAVRTGELALKEHLARTGNPGELQMFAPGMWRVVPPLPERPPRVSAVIPTRDRLDLLLPCVEGLLRRTEYPDVELVIVDHGSTEPATLDYLERLRAGGAVIVRDDGDFNFPRLVNRGVAASSGEVVALLNNDLEVTEPAWLKELVSQALRPEIGCVGALLLYPDGLIQHAGVVLGLGGVAGHVFAGVTPGQGGQSSRQRLVLNYSAVTGACLAVRREVWDRAGGFDEANLPVAFNDVDFCLRVRRLGLRNLWTPFARLVHHESASRGLDDTPEKRRRFAAEVAWMHRQWGVELAADPAYNPNLTLTAPDHSLAFPPRVTRVTRRLAGGEGVRR